MSNLVQYDEYSDEWLGLTVEDLASNKNALITEDPFFQQHPHLHLIDIFRNPDYLAYTAWVLFGVRLLPFQAVILSELWRRPFPLFVGCRGLGKTYLLAVYSMLRALFFRECKIVVVGAAFRQSKFIFEYCEKLWEAGPIYRSMTTPSSGTKKSIDKLVFHINDSTITAIPVGTGEKIRGLRGNTVIADEFDSHNKEIFETVIQGFNSVSSSPAENVVKMARMNRLKAQGVLLNEDDYRAASNQIIISGTAGYYFGTFYEYYKRYKAIIESQGNPNKLDEIFNGDIPDAFDWRDYSLIRIPYQLLPDGFMDRKTISRAKATTNKSIFAMEYEAVFAEDSEGFFRRSTIEGAVANDKNCRNPNWYSWCPAPFDPQLKGNSKGRYVMGIDPASEVDNLAICILECFQEHARLAYVWTTNKKNYQKRRAAGLAHEDGYYSFVQRKVRDLLKLFPCSKIGIDTQGGGYALMEALSAKNNLQAGEQPIWEVLGDPDKPKPSDMYEGLHIIEPIQFVRYEWTHEANFSLQKDLESGKLLFPRFDPATIEISILDDKARIEKMEQDNPNITRDVLMFDSLEDAVLEIEELKNELASIIITKAPGITSRFRWTVPEMRLEGNKKGISRKDRYSALLIANSLARQVYHEQPDKEVYRHVGGLVGMVGVPKKNMPLYTGPSWYTDGFNKAFR